MECLHALIYTYEVKTRISGRVENYFFAMEVGGDFANFFMVLPIITMVMGYVNM